MPTATVLANLIDSLDIAIWKLDTEYRVLSCNNKARAVYGENAVGDFCYHVAARRNSVCPNCPAQKVLEEGKNSGRSQHSRVTVNGRKIHIDHTATPLKNREGQVTGAVVSVADITHLCEVEDELKRHQNELEKLVAERTHKLTESETRYRLLLEESQRQNELHQSLLHSSSDAIIVYDMVGLVKYINPTFTEIFGWNFDELRGQRIPFLPESEREESMGHILALINEGTACHAFNTRRLTKNNRLIDVSLSASRYADHLGKPAGMLVILRDITRQVKAEKEAHKARKLESVGVLAGGIAHDFNNILTGILGNISLAQTLTDKGSELNKILTASAEASLRAKELTQQLLTFAKGGDPVKRVTNLEAIITDSTKFVLRGSNVKCVFDFARDLKPAKIDAGQISQVIQNIVSNADQAMPSGGIIKIKVENTRPSDSEQIELKSDDHLKITIEDQGCGIPPELIDNVFDPYFTTKTENSGLGLAITHSIINKHGGTITIETETDPNKKTGSTFSIYLPTTAQGKTAEPAEPTTRKIKSANITILIMDDEVMISELLKRILHKKGYKTITATDGEEALELYKETCASGGQIDLSILDLTVPGGMGGQETAQHLLKLNPQAKIVVSSGYFNDPIMANFKDYGFKAALTKPFQMVELLSTIENALVE